MPETIIIMINGFQHGIGEWMHFSHLHSVFKIVLYALQINMLLIIQVE